MHDIVKDTTNTTSSKGDSVNYDDEDDADYYYDDDEDYNYDEPTSAETGKKSKSSGGKTISPTNSPKTKKDGKPLGQLKPIKGIERVMIKLNNFVEYANI